ncbi:MAG: TIR domain-containing protein [Phycisphaera sp.]|nr:TIR domain-containing protein [Phycisphaera sp.]
MAQDNIFISYRRSDSADAVGRMYDRLSAHYGAEHVFKDVDSIPLGANFKQCIDDRIGSCRAFIAVIGPDWLNAAGDDGRRRLDDPRDYVRSEIDAALRLDIPVIPVLVRGGTMPAEDDLPDVIRDLALRHGMPLRADPDFHNDIDRLIQGIGPATKATAATPPPPPRPAGSAPRAAAPALDLNDDGVDLHAGDDTDPYAPPPLPPNSAARDAASNKTPTRRFANPLAKLVPNPAHRLMIGVPAALVVMVFGAMLVWAAADVLLFDDSSVDHFMDQPSTYNPSDGFGQPLAPTYDPTDYDDSGDTDYVIAGLVGAALVGVSVVMLVFAYQDLRLLNHEPEKT